MPAVVVSIVLLALNLRTVIASLPPLLGELRADLGLSATVAGLLTTLPVVAFGALAPAAPRLARRVGLERILLGCAALTAGSAALRGLGSLWALFAGSLASGVAVALAQGCLPLLIRLRHPERTGLLTGAYAMALPLGATLGAALSVPLAHALGWRGALAVWALPAVAAALVWLPPAARRETLAEAPVAVGLRRSGVAWWVALFFGAQSVAFYAQLAWLPTILEAGGVSEGRAGTLQAFGALVSAPFALLVPIVAARRARQTPDLAWIVAVAAVGVAGLLVAPGLPALWVALLGIGQGGALGLALVLPAVRGADAGSVAELTALSLCVGFLMGSTGPWLLGGAHDLSGGWTVPLLVLLAVTLLELAPGLPAVRAGRLATLRPTARL